MSDCNIKNPLTSGQVVCPTTAGEPKDRTSCYTQDEIDGMLEGKADLLNGMLDPDQDLYGPEIMWRGREEVYGETKTFSADDLGVIMTTRANNAEVFELFDPTGLSGAIGIWVGGGAVITSGAHPLNGDDGTTGLHLANLGLFSGLYVLHIVKNEWVLEGYSRLSQENNSAERYFDGSILGPPDPEDLFVTREMNGALITAENAALVLLNGTPATGFVEIRTRVQLITDGTCFFHRDPSSESIYNPDGTLFFDNDGFVDVSIPDACELVYQSLKSRWIILNIQ